MKFLNLHTVIESERCILKVAKLKHAEEMWDLISDKITTFMPWNKCKDISEQKDFILYQRTETERGNMYGSSLFLKDGKMIGIFGVPRIFHKTKTLELGYWLGEEYWGNGYIHEILECFKAYIYTYTDTENIIIKVSMLNKASCKVAQKAGFHLDGVLRKDDYIKGKFEDVAYFSFTKEDFKESRAKKK